MPARAGEGHIIKVADQSDGKDPITRFLDDMFKREGAGKKPAPQAEVPVVPIPRERPPQQNGQPLDIRPLELEKRPANTHKQDNNQAKGAENSKPKPADTVKPVDTVKSADTPKTTDAKPQSDVPASVRNKALSEINNFIKAPADSLSPVLLDGQTMVRNFMAEKDKSGALPKYESRASQIMQKSDQAYVDTKEKQAPIIRKAEQAYITENSVFKAAVDEMHEKMNKLPKPVREQANKLLDVIDEQGDNPVTRAKIKEQFKDHPSLVESMNEAIDARGRYIKADKALDDARFPLIQAALEQAETRFLFQRMCQLGGNKGKAERYSDEGELLKDNYYRLVNQDKPDTILPIRKV